MLVTNVQSRINEALSKGPPDAKPQDPPPLPTPITTATVFPPAPPPLTPVPPLALVSSKGGASSSSHAQYLLPHPPPQKRGVVITKLPGPFSTALSHAGDRKGREGSRHSSTSSLKSGDDPSFAGQSSKGSNDVIISGVSSGPQTVITLSPSPTGSLEEGQLEAPTVPSDKPQILNQDSDKESDSELLYIHIFVISLACVSRLS